MVLGLPAGARATTCLGAFSVTDPSSATGSPQTCTVGVSGIYDITAVGASGGSLPYYTYTGGLGTTASAEFSLTAGETLTLYVGAEGEMPSTPYIHATGGGGGSFVVQGQGLTALALVVVGGGGGATDEGNGADASLDAYGSDSLGISVPSWTDLYDGGLQFGGDGGGGGGGYYSGDGLGLDGAGYGGGGLTDTPALVGGAAFFQNTTEVGGYGGYGGGGVSGGEGGYEELNNYGSGGGGGGGSFAGSYLDNIGIDLPSAPGLVGGDSIVQNTVPGDGSIAFTPISVPELGTLALLLSGLAGLALARRRWGEKERWPR